MSFTSASKCYCVLRLKCGHPMMIEGNFETLLNIANHLTKLFAIYNKKVHALKLIQKLEVFNGLNIALSVDTFDQMTDQALLEDDDDEEKNDDDVNEKNKK